jgi:hypothetical protein
MERNLLIREIGDLSSSQQYFWRPPVIPAKHFGKKFSSADKAAMVAKIVADCQTELNLWSGKKETDTGMYDVVKGYWTDGVGLSSGEAATIIRERKSDILGKVSEPRHPWSAAFVSFIMRKAYPDFYKSRAHNRYIAWAKENRTTDAHPFQAFRVTEVAVEPGDIICFARSKKDWASYEHVKGKLTHGDIVTKVQNGFATTIGGNVNKNVAEKANGYALNSDGYLQQQYVTIKKKRLPKFIAIIKLLPYYEKGAIVSDSYDLPTSGFGAVNPLGYEMEQELQLPDCESREWATTRNGFTKVSWDITPKKTAKESNDAYETRKTRFVNRIHAVLTRSRKDPTDWFNSFTRKDFLGVKINNPIHIELATHLSFVERELIRRYGSASAAATTLGLSQTMSGGRGESATAEVSMHTFGIALDIEIHDNPYLGGKIPFAGNKKMMDSMKTDVYILSKAPKSPKKMDVLNVIFKRAGVLINGSESTYPSGFTYATRLDLYDQLKTLSALTVKYFNLVETANAAELTTLLKLNNSKEWKDLSEAKAIALINKDYDWFRSLVVRYSREIWVKGTGRKKVRKVVPDTLLKDKGFLSLDRRLVDDLGLSWGADYGDIMHFDMRNKCIGERIYSNRNAR